MNVKVPNLPSDYFSGMEIFFYGIEIHFFFGMIKQTYNRWSHQNLFTWETNGLNYTRETNGWNLTQETMGETLNQKI